MQNTTIHTTPDLWGLDAAQAWDTDLAYQQLQSLGEADTKRTAERRLHEVTSAAWEHRCRVQITAVLGLLEAERPARPWWFGDEIGHADIALACALRFVTEAHPGLIDNTDYPRLTAHAARAEALEVFQRIRQPFVAPA